MPFRTSFPAVVALLVMNACGGADRPPPVALGSGTQGVSADAVAAGQPPTATTLRFSGEIQRACDLSDTETYFSFDSQRIRDTEDRALKKIAGCFTRGPLAGRKLRLVGHADPRGDAEYNMVLGGQRADAVAAALIERNVGTSQISTASRGELDATGTSESSWTRDRRVDVELSD
jgi:peptidoglycan-associated lipoprotein